MAKEFKPEATQNEDTAGEQKIWSAIRYLDPDREDEVSRISPLIPAMALLVVIFMVWLLLHLLIRRL
jgi:hypothetical protein